MELDIIRRGLYHLTLITNAIRFFNGDFKVDYGRDLWVVPSYFGVVLNPSLGNTLPPAAPPGHPLMHRVVLIDKDGAAVATYFEFDNGPEVDITEMVQWWAGIREYVLVENTPYPRLTAMREHFRDVINHLEELYSGSAEK